MPSVKELVSQLDSSDQVVVFVANKELTTLATRATAPGNEAERAKLAAELAAELTATLPDKKDAKKHNPAARNRLCRLLSYVGGAKEVPALAEALADLDLREMARYALECNASPEAAAALVKALDDVGTRFRVGVVNSLGKKPGNQAFAALTTVAKEDADREVQMAAVEALANFAEEESDALMVKAAECPDPSARRRADRSRIRLAEKLRQAGNAAAARKIYESVRESKANPAQKKAAELGLKASSA